MKMIKRRSHAESRAKDKEYQVLPSRGNISEEKTSQNKNDRIMILHLRRWSHLVDCIIADVKNGTTT
jgi:hypothetical protein